MGGVYKNTVQCFKNAFWLGETLNGNKNAAGNYI
jgi:hypothetical protein